MCLICFCKDKFQFHLRTVSQMQGPSFEHTITHYMENFISSFNQHSSLGLCENHQGFHILNKRLMEIGTDEIRNVFTQIHNIYVLWVNSNTVDSMKCLETLFKQYNLHEFTRYIDDDIFFRGRLSNIPLSEWDMYHIPFNKRYLIKNQRYSLGGQPILYLSSSPLGVFNELNISREDIDTLNKLNICSFLLKSDSTPRKILDFCNYFNSISINDDCNMDFIQTTTTKVDTPEYISSMINNMIISTDNNDFNESNAVLDVKSKFILMILASCCSFNLHKTISEPFFIEEYVLPQLVAQHCQENNFDGIIYASCKTYKNNELNLSDDLSNYVDRFSDNLALFTTYSLDNSKDPLYVYDKNLYSLLKITSPLHISPNLDNLDIKDIEKEFNCFINDYSNKKITKELQKITANKKITLLTHIRSILPHINEYFKLIEGKLHIILLYNLVIISKTDVYINDGGISHV